MGPYIAFINICIYNFIHCQPFFCLNIIIEAYKASPDAFYLVITDMAMHNMTCDELAKELQKILPDIPIILCTDYSERIIVPR